MKRLLTLNGHMLHEGTQRYRETIRQFSHPAIMPQHAQGGNMPAVQKTVGSNVAGATPIAYPNMIKGKD